MQPRYTKPAGCAGCALQHSGFGFAPPAGPTDARLVFCGESLGYEEAIHGEPFYGAAGGTLSRVLQRAGIDRRHVRIANVVSCFPGDTIIEGAMIKGAYRRWFDGLLVHVKTAAGVLSGTPNHPVLTTRGWQRLDDLVEGDDLVRGGFRERTSSGHPHVYRRPLRADEAFDALAVTYIRKRIVGRDVDFHGDGRESQIDVISPDGLLGDWGKSTLPQQFRQYVFMTANANTANLIGSSSRCCTALDFVTRWHSAACGLMSSSQHSFTIDPSGALPSELHRSGSMTNVDTSSLQQYLQALLADAELLSDRFDAAPIQIASARILKVERRRFSGHVYNLATVSEEYTANGFIVHNCRPPNDYLAGAAWEDHAINQCRQYLQPVLDAVPEGGVVVPLGVTALAAILNLRGVPGVNVRDFHGTVTRSVDDRYWVVPTFHPSHLQRGAMNLLEVVTQDVQLASRISQRGFTRSPSQLVVDPHPDWLARWVDDHLRRCAADPSATHLSLDTEFAEKAGGADESEVVSDATTAVSPITRVNGGNDKLTGWTVPYRKPYIGLIDKLLDGVQSAQSWVWLWNKYADLDHLRNAGHVIDNYTHVDGMWLWKYLQSDLPRGLGFVAPMASDFGAWKHWGKDPRREGEYAAADGLQNWRTCMWLLSAAARQGVWDVFLRDWHERDVYVLRPAHDQGTPINRQALEAFHAELQTKLASVLARLKQTAAEGVLKPKLGYARKPKADKPPMSVIGKAKGEAKQTYMLEGVKLVEREIDVEVRACRGCGAVGVGPKHRCPKPKKDRTSIDRRTIHTESDRVPPPDIVPIGRPTADLFTTTRKELRYFWQLPFNPDAPAQVLAYLASQSIAVPIDKKKQRATTNKKALKQLQEQHQDDPFFQLQLDWKAVAKVDSTYCVGSLARLDRDDRLHPEFLPKPSTFRDSCQNPNLQNVVADKAGPEGLASGFRRCVEARDGVPSNRTADELAAWEARWLTT